MEEPQHFLYKHKIPTLFSKGVKAPVCVCVCVCVRETNVEKWMETAILTHNFLAAQGGDTAPAGHPTTSLDYKQTQRLKLDRKSHMGICIYHFITPTISVPMWLLPLISIGASCVEDLIDSSVRSQYATI